MTKINVVTIAMGEYHVVVTFHREQRYTPHLSPTQTSMLRLYRALANLGVLSTYGKGQFVPPSVIVDYEVQNDQA